jgi:hypothetical protein
VAVFCFELPSKISQVSGFTVEIRIRYSANISQAAEINFLIIVSSLRINFLMYVWESLIKYEFSIGNVSYARHVL